MPRFKKFRWMNFWAVCLIFLIVTGWVFSGWPRIWQNPPIPPGIEEVRADTETQSPDVLLIQTNLSGAVTDIDDDPDSPDALWLTYIATNADTICRVSFPTPTGNPTEGADLQEFKIWVRKAGSCGAGDPTVSISLYENGSSVAEIMAATVVSSTTGALYFGTWNANLLGTADGSLVESYVFGESIGGAPSNRCLVEVGAVEWNVDYTSGTLTVDIVDAAGDPVASPSIAMDAATFSFTDQTANGTFGVSTERIRVDNSTAAPAWTLTIAADAGSTAFWDGAASDYDFNDPTANAGDGSDTDSLGGQMTMDASVGTLGGTCSATDITEGSSASFSEGVTDSVTLLTAGASADTGCYWDLTGVSVSQTIPAEQPVASDYTINMTLTVTAS